jgi:methionyl-tRNA synthetase
MKTPQVFFITTAINYTNGSPHLGHAYEAICADFMARYHRILGKEVLFQTGTDEHGQKTLKILFSERVDFLQSSLDKLEPP